MLAAASEGAADDLERIIDRRLGRFSAHPKPYLSPADSGHALLDKKHESCSDSDVSSADTLVTGTNTPSQETREKRSIFGASHDCWCGWLHKRARGPFGSWQRRWFELRRQPSFRAAAAAAPSTPLFYYGSTAGGGPRRLEVTGARREAGLDSAAGAVLSVEAAGRRGRTLLAAGSVAEAERIVRELTLRLPGGGGLPPSPNGGTARAAARAC